MKSKWIFSAVVSSLILTGCYDSKELDERDFVISIGVDALEGNEIAAALGIAKGSDTGTGRGEVRTMEGSGFPQAIGLSTEKESRSMYFGHAKTLVLSSNLLENSSSLNSVIDTVLRNSQFSEKIVVLSTKGSAENILKTAEKDEESGLYVWDFYKNNSGGVENSEPLSFKDFSTGIFSGRAVVVPLISAEEGMSVAGGTVIDKSGVRGYLTAGEMQGKLYITGNAAGYLAEIDEGGTMGAVEITKSKGNISFEENNGLICSITVDAKGAVISMPVGNYKQLEEGFEKSIYKDISAAVGKMQSEIKADGIGVTDRLEKEYEELYLKYGEEAFEKMRFNIKVNGKISSNGVIQ